MNGTPRVAVGWVLAALILSASVVVATRTFSYGSSSSSVSGTVAPYIQFVAGADSAASDHVSAFAIGTNRTTFSATLIGFGGAKVVVTDLVNLSNVHAAAHAVTLTGTQVTNEKITNLSLEVFNGGTSLGYLDFMSAAPSRSLGSMAVGAVYTVRLVWACADGATSSDATATMTVRMVVSP